MTEVKPYPPPCGCGKPGKDSFACAYCWACEYVKLHAFAGRLSKLSSDGEAPLATIERLIADAEQRAESPAPSAGDGREVLLCACDWLHKRGHKSAATDLDCNWNDTDQPGDGSCQPLHTVPATPARAEPAGGWDAAMARWAVECLDTWASAPERGPLAHPVPSPHPEWGSGWYVPWGGRRYYGETPGAARIAAAKALHAADDSLPAPPAPTGEKP